ncbi:hypothetical protein BX666DRAFT_2019972 [Dichotomocladium elegans]|nr:hypothetical protein BX666DRAFT_2019972 [Dichotomocladium elegans]
MPSKSKKKSGPVPPVDEYYVQAMARFPVVLKNTKAKGRHAAAADPLESGVTVCVEDATAFVVRSDYVDKQCHRCLAALHRKVVCGCCRKAFYCSERCRDQDAARHTLVCGAIAQIDAIGRATDVDPDLLRLMALILARQQLENDRGTPFHCVQDLISHREHASPGFVHVITDASMINSNAHGLGDNEGRNTDVALGLFPLGAMFFNHACNPNCCFVGLEGGQLAFRTIRPVQKEEELTVSYIDLYAPRDERRLDLLRTKHFWCKCKRCQAPMARSVDRFLQGIVYDVYVIPPSSIETLTAEAKGEARTGDGSGDEDEKMAECALCGHAMAMTAVQSRIGAAQLCYMEGMRALRQQRDYRRARSHLERLAKIDTAAVAGELHPQAALRLNASIPLMNCLRHQDDIKAAIDMNKLILHTLEEEGMTTAQDSPTPSKKARVVDPLPRYTAEISDFWQNLGELRNIMANRYRDQGRKPLEKRYRNEAHDAFMKAGHVRAIVFGQEHPKTKAILHQAAEAAAGRL